MKGILLSLATLGMFIPSAMLASRVLRVDRHARLFFVLILALCPVYALAYRFLPPDLWCLPDTLVTRWPTLDALSGLIILLLNFHSFLNAFYGMNGGFSTCLLFEIRKSGPRGLSADSIVKLFQTPDGTDKIFAWRVPRLVETGYLLLDSQRGLYQLTAKSRWVACLTCHLQRIFATGEKGG